MELYIPSDVMPIILSYWDMKDRAKMAQINKAWNKCMYRTSIWEGMRWTPAPGTIGRVLHLPETARHIGSPYKACFFHWLENQRITQSKPIHKYYQYWKKKGYPCLYIQHHIFEDTIIASKQYKALSIPDQQYLFYRFTQNEKSIRGCKGYVDYIEFLLQEFQYIRMNMSRIILPVATGNDLASRFQYESLRIIQKNQEETYEYVKNCEHKLRSCKNAITKRGWLRWIVNEATFLKNPMAVWDSVALKIIL
jgi:hypothetical protein